MDMQTPKNRRPTPSAKKRAAVRLNARMKQARRSDRRKSSLVDLYFDVVPRVLDRRPIGLRR